MGGSCREISYGFLDHSFEYCPIKMYFLPFFNINPIWCWKKHFQVVLFTAGKVLLSIVSCIPFTVSKVGALSSLCESLGALYSRLEYWKYSRVLWRKKVSVQLRSVEKSSFSLNISVPLLPICRMQRTLLLPLQAVNVNSFSGTVSRSAIEKPKG